MERTNAVLFFGVRPGRCMRPVAGMLAAFLALFITLPAFAVKPAVRPPIKLAEDKFPTGNQTPEGVACDLARAFIRRDPTLFLATCIKPFGGVENKTYEDFLANTVKSMKEEAAKKQPSPGGPKRIGKCFAARHFPTGGPLSYGSAVFGFRDLVYVDVGVLLQNDKHQICRTLVIKDKTGKWAVHPRPDLVPILSAGMNADTASVKDFSEAYFIQ